MKGRVVLYNLLSRQLALQVTFMAPIPELSNEELQAEAARQREADTLFSQAVAVREQAAAAMKNREFDKSWGLFHQQLDIVFQYVDAAGYTDPRRVCYMEAWVREGMADQLRLERKHHQALVNLLFCVLANSEFPLKRHEKKLRAYFNRCKFKAVSLDEAVEFSKSDCLEVGLREIEAKVAEWTARAS